MSARISMSARPVLLGKRLEPPKLWKDGVATLEWSARDLKGRSEVGQCVVCS